MALFVFLVLYHGRQVEITSSLDFLWKQQAKKELEEMSEMRRHTNQLLQNILPLHVAKYFLEQDRQAEVSTVRNSVEKRCDLKKKSFLGIVRSRSIQRWCLIRFHSQLHGFLLGRRQRGSRMYPLA